MKRKVYFLLGGFYFHTLSGTRFSHIHYELLRLLKSMPCGRTTWDDLVQQVHSRVLSDAACNDVESAVESAHALSLQMARGEDITDEIIQTFEYLHDLRQQAEQHPQARLHFQSMIAPLQRRLSAQKTASGMMSLQHLLDKQWPSAAVSGFSDCLLHVHSIDWKAARYGCLAESLATCRGTDEMNLHRFASRVAEHMQRFGQLEDPDCMDGLKLWVSLQQQCQEAQFKLQNETFYQVAARMTARLGATGRQLCKDILAKDSG